LGVEKAGVIATLLTDVKRIKLPYFGQVIRKPGNCLEKIYHTKDTAGRKKGRPPISWFDNYLTLGDPLLGARGTQNVIWPIMSSQKIWYKSGKNRWSYLEH